MAKTPQKVALDLSALEDVAKEITALDTQISAASGSESAAKKALAQELATTHKDRVDEIVSKIIEQMNNLDLEIVIGIVDSLDDQVTETFKPAIDELLDDRVAKTLAGSKEGLDKLKESRKAKLESFKALRVVLEGFGFEVDQVPEPKRATRGTGGGSTGPKSAKNKEGYQYLMDGKNRPPSQNSFSSLAYYATEGVPAKVNPDDNTPRWGTAQLRSALAEAGIKFGEDDTWELKLPNDKVISARRFTPEELSEFDKADAAASAEENAQGDETTETAESVEEVAAS